MKSAITPSRAGLASAAALAAAFAAPGLLHAQEDYSDWEFSRAVTVNTTASGADVDEAVTRFPLLVRLTPAHEEVFANAKAGGADLRFTKADGVTRLPHQIARWDREARRAEVWVRVDTVRAAGYTTLLMHWSNSAAADSASGPSVFSAANDFVDVWHLGDATGAAGRPNATGGPPATPRGHAGALSLTPVDGVVGPADSLRGNAHDTFLGDHFDLGDGHEALGDFGAATLSLWVKPSRNAAGKFRMLGLRHASFQHDVWIGGSGDAAHRLSGQSIFSGVGTSTLEGPPESLEPDTWQHVAFTISATGVQSLYRNGALISQNPYGDALQDVARDIAYLGRTSQYQSASFGGVLDEATLSRVVRSDAWLKLSYQTQRPAPAGVSIGPALPRTLIARRVVATDFVSTPRWTVPDYVFDPDYRLRGLAETEAFVKTHRHLPGVPNAARIAADGLDLGVMNLRLLKAVEELTLHVIALDKRAAALEARRDDGRRTDDAPEPR